jgi:hypothetical protein
VDAILKKNINAIEQNKNVLSQYVAEGMKKLDTMKAFNNDRTMVNATKQTFEFYKTECSSKIDIISNFLVKEETFTKTKKAFEAKRENERTKEDVDQYNKMINEFNGLINTFNSTTNFLNQERTKTISNWNKTSQTFLDKQVP